MRENETRPNPAAWAAKALVVLALCLLAPAAALAQWTQPAPPDTNISNTNAGNVGVGTNAPNFKLEVSGSSSRNTFAVTGDGDSVGYAGIKIRAQSTAGIATNRAYAFNFHIRKDSWYSGDASGPSLIIEANSPTGGFAAPIMITPQNHVILNGGRGNGGGLSYGWVGVGTTAPAANLHVNSQYGLGAVRVSGAGGGLMHFYDTSAPANQKFYQWRSEGGLFRMALLNDAESGWVQQNILVANSSGNVGVGTAAPTEKLEVVGGNLKVGGTITGDNIVAKFQDVAEWVPSTQKLNPGTVVVLDAARANHVVASSSAYDTKVAGVISAEPGVILGVAGEGRVKVATTGRVRVKVDASRGAIRVGDLLVTSEVEGVAMRSVPVDLGGTQIHRPGTIIGKALEPLEKGTGEILTLLSLQ